MQIDNGTVEVVMENLQQYISDFFALDPTMVSKAISSALIVVALILMRFIVIRIVTRHTEDVRARYTWRKSTTYISVIIGSLVIGRVWFSGFQSLTTYLGLVSAGVAIALKDPLSNLAAWLFIVWRRPFTPGDRIEIGGVRGDVIDQRIFQFTVMEIGNWVDGDQSTGRVVRIPNGKVFTEPLANYSKGFQFIWDEVQVLVTFESDWKKAKSILLEIAQVRTKHLTKEAERRVQEASAKMMIFYRTLTPIVYTSVKDSGIMFSIRFLCDPRGRRKAEEEIWEDILDRFDECDDIDFAYPTHRLFDNALEGKPMARAEIPPQANHTP